MSTSTTASRLRYGASALTAFVLGILAAQFFNWAKEFGGDRRYDPSTPEGLVLSRRLAYEARPLLDAIAAYRSALGKMPTRDNLERSSFLSPAYKNSCFKRPDGWGYLPQGENWFFLFRKVGWDTRLIFDSRTGTWKYDPGDGSAMTAFDV